MSLSSASLRFQPTKRPQLSAQKLKTKPPPPKAAPPDTDNNRKAPLSAQEESNFTARPAAKSTLADWAAEAENDDVNGFYGPEKRQRGGRKKRKKNKDEPQILQNWDDIYDPSRPNSYEEYLHSDEKLIEIREWKDRLYAHRMTRGYDSNSESDGVDYNRPQSKSMHVLKGLICILTTIVYSSGPNPSFAPPSNYEEPLTVPTPSQPPEAQPKDSPKPVDYPQSGQSATVQFQNQSSKPSQPEVSQHPFSPKQAQLFEAEIADTPSQNFLQKPQSGDSSVPHKPSPNISRAPVRYNLPPPPPEIPDSEAELEKALLEDNAAAEESTQETDSRSLRPGQKDFAQRLMSKYGWTKGAGLGASGTGIINPLQVKIEKQKKDPDSQGGKAIGQANRGKIIGGKKKAGTENDSKFGSMSEVVVLHGMVDGMDLDAEMDSGGDGDLIQEIGDECAEKVPFNPLQRKDPKLTAGSSTVVWKGLSSIEAAQRIPLC